MRGLLAVAGRELSGRKGFFAVALFAGFLPFFAPLVPGLGAYGAPEARGMVALVFGTTLAAALAIGLGASSIGSELSERRFGFWFARPLHAAAIAGGKLFAAALLVLGSFFLTSLPAGISRGRLFGVAPVQDGLALVALLALALLVLLAFSHAASVAVRSRSPWIVLDLLLLPVVALALWSALRRLILFDVFRDRSPNPFLLVGAVLAVLLLAGFAQTSAGRIDLGRGHRALQLTLWGILVPLGALAQGYTAWVLAATPADLVAVYRGRSAPSGSWISVFGAARGRGGFDPTFLLNPETMAFVRLAGNAVPVTEPAFSADGARAAWAVTENPERSERFDLVVADLTGPAPRAVGTPLSFANVPSELSLSDSGRRLAVQEGPVVSVYEVATGRVLASARVPAEAGPGVAAFFVGEDRVRLFTKAGFRETKETRPAVLLELDVSARKLVVTGRVEPTLTPGTPFLRAEAGGGRLLVLERGGEAVSLCDGRTGAPLARLVSGGASTRTAIFLSGGGVAVRESGADGAVLKTFSAAGAELWTAPLGRLEAIGLAGEVAPGKLVVSGRVQGSANPGAAGGRVFVADLESRKISTAAEGLMSFDTLGWWFRPMLPSAENRREAATLFLDAEHRLVRFDPLTGVRRVLLGKAK